MIDEIKFKDMGNSLVQIGAYLMNIDPTLFADTELHRNIVSMLSQLSLYLNDNLGQSLIKSNVQVVDEKKYLSKAEAIELYHPLITEYSLTQAIKKDEIKYLKRGAKYFFSRDELSHWVDEQKSGNNVTGKRTSVKFV